jgi:hypothetical protein
MVLARRRRMSYFLWFVFCVGVTVGFFLWHRELCIKHGRPLTGSSPAAFWAGVVAASIMLFETALSLRKRWRRVRPLLFGLVRWWLHAHIWLGLLTLPLVWIHTGGYLGGSYNVLLLTTFGVVWVSGVVGFLFQQWLPTKLLEETPQETVANAIPVVVNRLLESAKRVLPVAVLESAHTWDPKPFALAGGAKSLASHHGGMSTSDRSLMQFHDQVLFPFLKDGGRRSPLADPSQADVLLNGLVEGPDDQSAEVVRRWRGLCDERRDLDRQLRLHSLLHSWLMVHVPATAVLLLLLAGHVFVAWRHAVWQGW